MTIYLAGPLFTLAERRFNEELAAELRKCCPALEIFLPQQCDSQFQGQADVSRRIFDCLMQALDDCDLLVAILDGSDTDSGTCIEIGYARARGKPVIGVRTDFRAHEDQGLNLMTLHICTHVLWLPSTRVALAAVAEQIAAAALQHQPA